MNDNDVMFNVFIQDLLKDYVDYTTNISTPIMAVSFECVVFMIKLCKNNKFINVLDMGSGFSSFALRKYKKIFDNQMNIISVDTSDSWLDKTKGFIESKGLDSSGLVNLNGLLDLTHTTHKDDFKYDFVFYDIAYYQDGSRQKLLPFLINELPIGKNSYILFDDVNIQHYFMFILDYLSTNCKYIMYNTKFETNDSFGRFSMLFTVI